MTGCYKQSTTYLVMTQCTFKSYLRYKRVCGNFLACLCKNKKRPVSTHLLFYIFINNLRSKQNKKNLEHPFLDIIK